MELERDKEKQEPSKESGSTVEQISNKSVEHPLALLADVALDSRDDMPVNLSKDIIDKSEKEAHFVDTNNTDGEGKKSVEGDEMVDTEETDKVNQQAGNDNQSMMMEPEKMAEKGELVNDGNADSDDDDADDDNEMVDSQKFDADLEVIESDDFDKEYNSERANNSGTN